MFINYNILIVPRYKMVFSLKKELFSLGEKGCKAKDSVKCLKTKIGQEIPYVC